MHYIYPAAGVFFDAINRSCTFTVWAPEQEHVWLHVHDKRHSMQKDERGYWQTMLPGVQAGDLYQYELADGKLRPDPASRRQPDGVHGASAVTDGAFSWTDDSWTGLPLEDMILYELHTGTFSPEGNFDGVVAKLDHLQRLGINAIELLPVAAFPGQRNWGYDGVFPFAVQESYGGIDGLKRLVDAAHQRGIAVILDVVYNHLGPDGNYLPAYGPYFTDKYKSVWGNAINFDDAWCDGVRHYFWQNALMWLDEFHIDGLRLDAVHAIWDSGADHFIAVLQRKVRELEATSGRRKVLIAEFDLNNPRYIKSVDRGGYGLDGQWIDEFHHALHALTTGEVNGYYEDFGEPWHLVKALRDSYVYTGQYSVHRKKHFGVPVGDLSYGQFVVFAQNHDQVGNRLLGDRLTTQLSLEGLKLVAAAVLLSPHVPLLFMGEEYGEQRPFQYFVDHTDPRLIEVVRKGRKEEFAYFNWEGEVPDPASEDTYRQCKLSWNTQDRQASTLLDYYQFLITFRKSRAALWCKEREHLKVLTIEEPGIIAVERLHQQDRLLLFFNFNKVPIRCTFPLPLSARKVFDSAGKRWNGPGEFEEPDADGWMMQAESVIVYEILFT